MIDRIANKSPLPGRAGCLVAWAVFGLAACGSGSPAKGGDGSSSCSATLSPGASMSWQDDGTAECANLVSADYAAGSASDVFQLIGTTASGEGIGIGVSTTAAGTTIGGIYSCPSGTGVLLNFTYQQGGSTSFGQICSLSIGSADGAGGAHATGSFSATVTLSSGGTKTISNGIFDSPVVVSGG